MYPKFFHKSAFANSKLFGFDITKWLVYQLSLVGITTVETCCDSTQTPTLDSRIAKLATPPVGFAVSDELTALTTGTSVITFRMPYAMTLSKVKAGLTTAQASGTIFTIDILQNGVSILSTLLTIDNTEKTSVTAAIQAVISTTALIDDAEMTVSITQIGDGTATGLKIWLI